MARRSHRASPGLTQYIVDLKSQTWRTEKDVDHPVWQHGPSIVKPAKPASRLAFLRITGGANGGGPPRSADRQRSSSRKPTSSVVAELKMVQNHPLVLNHDGVPRKEDDFIAYTWDQFLKTGDETWPTRLPMVKNAVRAMDCVQELLASDQGGRFAIEGSSCPAARKRLDDLVHGGGRPRVAAAIPIVIDVINVPACSRHHIAAYGFYAEAVGDYVRHNIKGRADDPKIKLLYAIEDPYSYRERLTMPKFVVNASGDQYFSSRFIAILLRRPAGREVSSIRPQTPTTVSEIPTRGDIIAFYQTILAGSPRPKYSWTFESDGSIRVQTADAPKAVQLWQATNPSARDFRVKTIGKAYKSQTLRAEGGVYVGKIDPPENGWTAFFVELTFDVNRSFPLKLSTAVRILPDTLPYAGLDPAKAPLEPRPASK